MTFKYFKLRILSSFRKMGAKLAILLFLLHFRNSKAVSECSQITLDECEEGLPFETLRNIDPETCQTLFCNEIFAGRCTFFIFDHVHKKCQLYETPIASYAQTCDGIGAPRGIDFTACKESTDPCNVSKSIYAITSYNSYFITFQRFREGYCRYEDLSENVEGVTTADLCNKACTGDAENCEYFLFKNLTNGKTNCEFTNSRNHGCDLLRGPPTPDFSTCLTGMLHM